MKTKLTLKDIKDEVELIRRSNPRLEKDSSFVSWFLRSFVVSKESDADDALTGTTGDKDVDAIIIDDATNQIIIVQGKYRQSDSKNEKRSDVLSFINICDYPWASKSELEAYYNKLDPLVKSRLQDAFKKIKKRDYSLILYYVTSGRCSYTIKNEAIEKANNAYGRVEAKVFDFPDIIDIFKDYLDGVAPAVPTLKLKVRSVGAVQHEGMIRLRDPERNIESWVFSMSSKDVGTLFTRVGQRLFARNIRGYLGETNINKDIEKAIRNEPNNFWYYNNGITMICYNAKEERERGEHVLIVERAQVINGQQTTITLSNTSSENASVLVKVIKIPPKAGQEEHYDNVVNKIVKATNWQNHILSSDLVSNSHIQVYLERELRKRNYQYIRKRMTKKEARKHIGHQNFTQIDKFDFAQAVAATLFDPKVMREGKERLFEEPYYKSVFNSKNARYYLPRYWVLRKLKSSPFEHSERSYGIWLAMHFSWQLIGEILSTAGSEKKFRYSCESNDYYVLDHLDSALTNIFRAVMRYYRLNRGKGKEAKNANDFFKIVGNHKKFEKFWRSKNNPYRERVKNQLVKFKKKLKQVDTND